MFCSPCCEPKNGKADEEDTISPSWFSDIEQHEEGPVIDLDMLKEESFIRVPITKPTPNAMLGIAYQRIRPDGWRIVISKITPMSPVAKTSQVKLGQTILGVNDKACTEWKKLSDLTTLLRSFPNKLTLVVTKSVTASVFKKTEATKTGIVFCEAKHPKSKVIAIWIYVLASKGLFDQTGVLQKGMRVVAINGQKCPPTLTEAQDIVEKAVGHLSVVAVPEQDIPFPTSTEVDPSPSSMSSLSDGAPDEQKI